MIIDAHAHLVMPESLWAHGMQLLISGHLASRIQKAFDAELTDDYMAQAAAQNLARMDAVGTDMQLLSPRPFVQLHSVMQPGVVHAWTRANNDAIATVVGMHPDRFAGVGGLPTAPGAPISDVFEELDRLVTDLNFVGVCLNPDPYEGRGPAPVLSDEYWYPLWERLVELDVPAQIHSAGCFNERETYSEHFVTEESIAILSSLRSTLFEDFPKLKLIISHGGGSVPYQVGRWQAERHHPELGGGLDAERFEVALRRFWFDTVLHYPPSLELLVSLVGADRCLFGTERPGSGSAPNPDTGRPYDDLKPIIEEMGSISADERQLIFHDNALSVFPRLRVPQSP